MIIWGQHLMDSAHSESYTVQFGSVAFIRSISTYEWIITVGRQAFYNVSLVTYQADKCIRFYVIVDCRCLILLDNH